MTLRCRPYVAAVLGLVLFLTSLTVAHARGQVTPAGEMVLCLGGHAVTVAVDENGNPVEYTHVCSDFAMSFFVEAGGSFVPSHPQPLWSDAYLAQGKIYATHADQPAAQARGPPWS